MEVSFRPRPLSVLLFVLASCASSGGDRPDAGASGDAGAADAARPDAGPAFVDSGPLPDGGGGSPFCDDGTEWIYVVDREGRLAQFRPSTMEFVDVAPLGCAAAAGTPRSMSIDQNAVAHVLYSDANIYTVSTTDGSCSGLGNPAVGADFTHFGMGFTANGPESSLETLFIVGGNIIELMEDQDPLLASIDTLSHVVTPIGRVPDWVELTGNRNGDLYTFRPSTEVFTTRTPARIDRLDKTTGASLEGWDLDTMDTGDLRAWAFAWWGGRFYIFVQEDGAPSSDVWRFTPDTGVAERILTDVGRGITGAGVSICAPVTLI